MQDPLTFLIGGVPRSGTTIVSKFMNTHEDAYSYSSETNILRYAWEFAGTAPVPEEQYSNLRKHLAYDMNIALIDHFEPYKESLKRYQATLMRYNPAIPDRPILPIFDKQDVASILDELMELFESGLYGEAMIAASSDLLARWLRKRSGRELVGEKTPDNIFVMPYMAKVSPHTVLFCCLRDPLYTINSMMRRAQDNKTEQDKAFSADFIGSLGNYTHYMQAVADTHDAGRVRVVKYEDLTSAPGPTLHRMLQAIGLAAPNELRMAARVLVGQVKPQKDPRGALSDSMIRLASIVLDPYLKRMDVDYGLSIDNAPVPKAEKAKPDFTSFLLHKAEKVRANNAVAIKPGAIFAVPVQSSDSQMKLSVAFDGTTQTALKGAPVSLTFTGAGLKAPLTLTFDAAQGKQEQDVVLNGFLPVQLDSENAICVLEMRSNLTLFPNDSNFPFVITPEDDA